MKLSKIAEFLNEVYHGEDVDIDNVGSLDSNFENAILYIENIKYLDKAKEKNPAALVIPRGIGITGMPFIEVDDPKYTFIRLLNLFNKSHVERAIDASAIINKNVNIGNDVAIMSGAVIMEGAVIRTGCVLYPNCVIEKNCVIGEGTILYSGVIIREGCVVGNNCIIHSGAVIGSDGYGFYEKNGNIIKIPQIGTVKIGDRVEIGANTAIDRATVGKTEIGNDTKLDNLVHVAHNVKIGEKCYIAAQAGISGSVVIGNHVMILGQVGIADHLTIADNTIIMPQSGIPNDVKKAEVLFGTPARPVKEHHRIHAALKYLPDLLKRVKLLESKLNNNKNDH